MGFPKRGGQGKNLSMAHKNPISFADVVHQSIVFRPNIAAEKLVLDLIDTPWVQRLRDISQTANTRLVYMFSEHSRFGHCLGVAYLAATLLARLEENFPKQVAPFKSAILAAALLHDIGHLAPGSHTAFKTWFPNQADSHEEIALRVIRDDPTIQHRLLAESADLPLLVAQILAEDSALPPWTWEIISGGGWNVDRGNWCMVDSIMAGVSYGRYNIPALVDSLVITEQGHLAIRENRLDAMMHFAVSRHAMYRQIYQHRVLLAADTLNTAIARRARTLGSELSFCDPVMTTVLAANGAEDLSLESIFAMREPWWRYHLSRWTTGQDAILADLSKRLIDRRLLKTIRVTQAADHSQLMQQAHAATVAAGFDPEYYLHQISLRDLNSSDQHHALSVILDDGTIRPLGDADPLYRAMVTGSSQQNKTWLVLPSEVKLTLRDFSAHYHPSY